MKRITLSQLINLIMFLYVLSIYLFTFRTEWTIVSNSLAFVLMALIWLEILMVRKKIIFNHFLIIYLLFIIVCMVSVFYAINPSTALSKVQTLMLIFMLMMSLINYVDTFKKLDIFIKCFIYSGFIAGIYLLMNTDFTALSRIGGELGNANAIGMIIGISSILALYYFLKTKNYWYVLIILTNFIVILLTGSRKSLLFVVVSIVFLLIFQKDSKWTSKLKALFVSAVLIFAVFYVINYIPVFYEIIGIRMMNMFDFISGVGTSEGSMNNRSDMILWGWKWFKERLFFGYGIDNYRFLYGSISDGGYTYSHNNLIELLVGIGIVGTVLFYLSYLVVIKDLLKASKLISKTLCYSFIAIAVGYMVMSVGLVYYYGKHISIILAVGSILYQLAKTEKSY